MSTCRPRARTNDVLTNLVEAGYMSAGQVHAARLNPAKFIDTRPTHSPDWFLDWAFEEAQRLGEGRGHYVLTARTTVDLGMQQSAQSAMINILGYTRSRPTSGYTGALVSMEPEGAGRTWRNPPSAHRRFCPLRQRRQSGQALWDPGDVQLQGRAHLFPRQGRARGTAGREPACGRADESDDASGGDRRHWEAGG